MNEEKLYNEWNKQKVLLQTSETKGQPYPREGEVWMSFVGKNIGFEQNGAEEGFSRPVLVIKKFNNKIYWIVPLSSRQKSINFYYNFTDPNNLFVSLIMAQLRLISIKRFKRKMYDMPCGIFESVRIKLMEYLI